MRGVNVVLRSGHACVGINRAMSTPPLQENAMSNTPHTGSNVLKPRAIKRMRQSQAGLHPQREPLRFPDPEPPVWKPLG